MKTLIKALLLMVLVVSSVPLALAEEGYNKKVSFGDEHNEETDAEEAESSDSGEESTQTEIIPPGATPVRSAGDLRKKEVGTFVKKDVHRLMQIESALTKRTINEIFARYKSYKKQLKEEHRDFTIRRRDFRNEMMDARDIYKDGRKKIGKAAKEDRAQLREESKLYKKRLKDSNLKHKEHLKKLKEDMKARREAAKKEFQDAVKDDRVIRQTVYARVYLGAIIEEALIHLSMVENRIMSHSEAFTDEEQNALLAKIDVFMERLEVMREEVDTKETKEEIKEMAKQVASLQKEFDDLVKETVSELRDKENASISHRLQYMKKTLSCSIETIPNENKKNELQKQLDGIDIERESNKLRQTIRSLSDLLHKIKEAGGSLEECSKSILHRPSIIFEKRAAKTDVSIFVPGVYVNNISVDNDDEIVSAVAEHTGLNEDEVAELMEESTENEA